MSPERDHCASLSFIKKRFMFHIYVCAVEAISVNDHQLFLFLRFFFFILFANIFHSFIFQIMITVCVTGNQITSLKFHPRLHLQTFTAIYHKRTSSILTCFNWHEATLEAEFIQAITHRWTAFKRTFFFTVLLAHCYESSFLWQV